MSAMIMTMIAALRRGCQGKHSTSEFVQTSVVPSVEFIVMYST